MSPTKICIFILIAKFAVERTVAASLGSSLHEASQCGVNETWALKCASMKEQCEDHCYDIYPRIKEEPICSDHCQGKTPMCLCNPGYARIDGSSCILREECPTKKCLDENEEKVMCNQPIDPKCQPTCEDPSRDSKSPLLKNVRPFYCTWGFCDMLVCACKEGFLRHDESLRCIPKEKCL